MAEIALKLTKEKARRIFNRVAAMPGSKGFKDVRVRFLKRILETWKELDPENEDGLNPAAVAADVVREVKIDPAEQKAVAEGFVSLCSDEKFPTLQVLLVKEEAKWCRLAAWVNEHLREDTGTFSGKLDDEIELADPEPTEKETVPA